MPGGTVHFTIRCSNCFADDLRPYARRHILGNKQEVAMVESVHLSSRFVVMRKTQPSPPHQSLEIIANINHNQSVVHA
jgi:hypothetical protein